MSLGDFLELHFVSLYVLALIYCACQSGSSAVAVVRDRKGEP